MQTDILQQFTIILKPITTTGSTHLMIEQTDVHTETISQGQRSLQNTGFRPVATQF